MHEVKLINGVLFLENYFPEVSGESVSHRKLRYSKYKECWETMKRKVKLRLYVRVT